MDQLAAERFRRDLARHLPEMKAQLEELGDEMLLRELESLIEENSRMQASLDYATLHLERVAFMLSSTIGLMSAVKIRRGAMPARHLRLFLEICGFDVGQILRDSGQNRVRCSKDGCSNFAVKVIARADALVTVCDDHGADAPHHMMSGFAHLRALNLLGKP